MQKSTLKTWAPLVGLLVLVVSTILRLFGQGDLADALGTIGAFTGLTDDSPIPAEQVVAIVGQVAAAGVALWGFVRKVKAEVQKRRLGDEQVLRRWP